VPAIPSIKATGFQSAADDLERLIAEGRMPRADLEAQLEAEDLSYLGKKLAASSWVPVATYVRVLELLIALEAGRDVQGYLRGRGMRAAERLHKMGLYGQFEATIETWGHRVGTITATMGAVLYNFSRWSFETDVENQTFQTTVDDARHYADPLIHVGEGFIHYLATNLLPERKVEVVGKRTKPDQIVFRGEFA
jgi:hypothetical protein